MRSSALLLLGLLTWGCGSDRDSAPPVSTVEERESPAGEEPEAAPRPSDEPEAAEPAAVAPTETNAQLLARGRAAFRAERYDEASQAFFAALAQTPSNGGLACETGWAFHHAGDEAKARELLTHGTRVLAARPGQERSHGACLYNLGRIAEDAGRAEEAAQHYQRSLRARPNAVVRARLESLEGALASTRQLFGSAAESLMAAEGFGGGESEGSYVEDLGTETLEVAARGEVLELALTSFTDGGAWGCYYYRLVARVAGGWTEPTELGDACTDQEAEGIFDLGEVRWLSEAASSLLLVNTSSSFQGCFEGACSSMSSENLLFVRYAARQLEVLASVPLQTAEEDSAEATNSDYRTQVTIGDDGRLTITATEGAPPPWMLGTHTAEALIAAASRGRGR